MNPYRNTKKQLKSKNIPHHVIRVRKHTPVPTGNVIDLRHSVPDNETTDKTDTDESHIFSGWFQRDVTPVSTDPEHILKPKIPKKNKKSLRRIQFSNPFKNFLYRPQNRTQSQKIEYPSIRVTKKIQKQKPEPKPKRSTAYSFEFPSRHFIIKQVVIFFVLAFLITLPFYVSSLYTTALGQKQQLTLVGKEGILHLQKGADYIRSNQYDEASAEFDEALESFSAAEYTVSWYAHSAAAAFGFAYGPGDTLSSADHMVLAGKEAALAGQNVTDALQAMKALESLGSAFGITNTELSITTALSVAEKALKPAATHLKTGISHLEKVDSNVVPQEYRAQFVAASAQFPVITSAIDQSFTLFDGLLTLLGDDADKRYLIVFGNNDELRASLGFIGGFALVDVSEGKVESLEVPGGGVYDASHWLDTKVQAPGPLRLVNPYWQFQDGNWWPDWPSSARKLMWFYDHSQGPTVDGVIGITPDVVESLLTITGPIDMVDEYGFEVTSENFRKLAQDSAEIARKGSDTPKQFLSDFAPKLLNEVFKLRKEEMLPTLLALHSSLSEKDMLVYFRDATLEKAVTDFGWAGQIKQTDKDYLSIVKTNIAGGKTDGVIDDSISHTAEVQDDGTVIDTVRFTRVHNGDPANLLQGVKNTSFIRFYVPQGSQLISASGFTKIPETRFLSPDDDSVVDDDLLNIDGQVSVDELTGTRVNTSFGKTVFGNWLELAPGDGKTVTITYTLPFKLDMHKRNGNETYTLLIQKQSGARDSLFTSEINFPDSVTIIDASPVADVAVHDDSSATFFTNLKQDTSFGVVID